MGASKKPFRTALNDFIEYVGDDAGSPRTAQILREMFMTLSSFEKHNFDIVELRLMNTALKELRHALKVFKPYRPIPKVAVFGSARTPHKDPNYRLAVRFGQVVARKGWMVITGGASGIMEAAMVGAGAKNSFGLNILLPFEQNANPVIRDNAKLMFFKYFFTRKLIFLKESEATVLFPGGFGTFDEGYESLTLVQTGKAKPRPIVLVDSPGSGYWKSMIAAMRRNMQVPGYVSQGDLDLMRHFQDATAAVEAVTGFYSNYHSSRFLKDLYLIRLRKKLSARALEEINRDYKDILINGGFERFTDLEQDDEKDPKLERIVFRFDRSNYSRLRQLIDRLNR